MGKASSNTQARVADSTSERISERLRREMEARVYYFAQSPDQIDARLEELDAEWDIERVLAANATGVSLFGILMGRRHRRWHVLPFAAAGLLLQQAIQGWCPLFPVFRKLGIRTAKEINDERHALRVLRGDFNDIDMSSLKDPCAKAERALRALQTSSS
ncbi:MAG: MerC domain-containing protein [Sedimentisphaerales bacterium]|jgi:hypothetical protein